jgi:Mor family transcriptional regulator
MYTNAEDILPIELLKQVQEYIQGKEIYIPKCDEERLGWGEKNGARAELKERNHDIIRQYRAGISIPDLMDEFHLSYDSIRKIVRNTKQR